MLLKAFLTLLAMVVRPTFGTWAVTRHVIVRNITTDIVESTVYPTASVSPISTSTKVGVEYLLATQNGFGRAVVNVTTSYLMLPTEPTNLPILTVRPTTSASPSIQTNYYIPVTVSNPQTCTLTDFTYTDTVGIMLPSSLVPRATESDLALLVTTYESTIRTNLGGQPVTTSICDVYFKSDAVPVTVDGIGIDPRGLLSECVDPREHMCNEPGQNSAATGSGGCVGPYPPTAGRNQASTTKVDYKAGPTETGGARSWRGEMGCLIFFPSFMAISLLMV